MNSSVRILDVVHGTIVDGVGLRTSVYFAGCKHGCHGCHNPQSWPMDSGREVGLDELMSEIANEGLNVTLTGGDPLYQIEAVLRLCNMIHSLGKTVWIYTGFTYEQILADKSLRRVLYHADVLVDGPYDSVLRDTSLWFRGSSNQRIIDLNKTRENNIVEFELCQNIRG